LKTGIKKDGHIIKSGTYSGPDNIDYVNLISG
jgi:hypothetical protein